MYRPFILGQAIDAPQGWVALIVQTGAIGILGYHLLKGLPAMFKEWREDQKAMQSFLAAVFQKATEDNRADFTARSTAMTGELRQQTAVLNLINDKISEWPSDVAKICKADMCRQLLAEKGFDVKTIDRLVRLKLLDEEAEGSKKKEQKREATH